MGFTRLGFVGLMLLATLTAAPTGLAQGNSDRDAAAACLNGGYAAYHDENGVPFKSQGQCIKFVAQGGNLEDMPIFLVITLDDDPCCFVTVTGKGLEPNSLVSYTFTAAGGTLGDTFTDPVQSDGTFFDLGSWHCGLTDLVATATTGTGGTIDSNSIDIPCPPD